MAKKNGRIGLNNTCSCVEVWMKDNVDIIVDVLRTCTAQRHVAFTDKKRLIVRDAKRREVQRKQRSTRNDCITTERAQNSRPMSVTRCQLETRFTSRWFGCNFMYEEGELYPARQRRMRGLQNQHTVRGSAYVWTSQQS